MRLMICGICGRMGREIAALAMSGAHGARLICGVDTAGVYNGVPCYRSFARAKTDVDCVIDFSNHAATNELISFAVQNSIPLVIATTGQTDEEKQAIKTASAHIPIFMSPNYSLGIAALIGFAKKLTAIMPDSEIEIIETHHDKKADAPSGTASAIADAICAVRHGMTVSPGRTGYGERSKSEIGIHSVRLTNAVGTHEVIFASPYETIRLTHEAHDRRLYADGALAAAEFICSLPMGSAGLYGIDSMIREGL